MSRSKSSRLKLKHPGPVERIPDSYISVALDASQIVGGHWWDSSQTARNGLGISRVPPLNLEDKNLIQYARLLHPRYLRIGGTEADRLFYAFSKKTRPAVLPEGYNYLLGKKRWKEIEKFCGQIGAGLMMTINAGPGPRVEKQRWRRKNARHFLKFTDNREISVEVLELGNEVNAYPFFMGLSKRIRPAEYAEDISRLAGSLPSAFTSQIAGPAAAVWPVIGETLPFIRRFLKAADDSLNILTWHYYPQQSRRTPLAVRRARKQTLLKPSRLDEASRQARRIVRLRDKYHPACTLWLGETGHAQCGGEPGLSDTFYSGFWWLEQLGLMALCGQKQIIRQTLTGGDYGLLDKEKHTPLPDFWTSLLWNRYAGSEVFSLETVKNKKLRLYLHSLRTGGAGYCLIYINLDTENSARLIIDEELPPIRGKALLTAPKGSGIYGKDIELNGRSLKISDHPSVPSAETIQPSREMELPPGSYGFLLLYPEEK